MKTVATYTTRTAVLSVKIDPEIRSQFKQECRIRSLEQERIPGLFSLHLWSGPYPLEDRLKRGVHQCCVVEALLLAWIEGQRAEASVIKPVQVNMTLQHVVKRPRRKVRELPPYEVARSKTWPPSCEHADNFMQCTKEVACLDLKDWISLEKCWRCYLAKGG